MIRTRFAVLGATFALAISAVAGPASAAGDGVELAEQHWSWDGIFGGFDQAQLQRGYLVYEAVCAACHSMNLVAFRHLHDLGFNEEQIDAIASNRMVQAMDTETGEMVSRPGRAADVFPAPFANDTAAAYALGKAPPDLSVIAKAREGGTDYLYNLLVGYHEAPADFIEDNGELSAGQYYNTAYPGHVIAMGPPLSDGLVQYIDDTPNTVDQMSRDVSAFLTWAAEPSLVERKELGVKVILFLIVLAGIAYAVKRKVWSDVEH